MSAKDDILPLVDDLSQALTALASDAPSLLPATVVEATDLLVTCPPGDYSASTLARAVEDCDAHLLNLNVHPRRDDAGDLMISLRVNRLDGESVARSVERYGYRVLSVRGPLGPTTQAMRDRASEVVRLLEV